MDKSNKTDLKNRHLEKAHRISAHLIRHDTMNDSSKLSLLALQRYYMIKYLKSIRTSVEKDNKKPQRLYSLSLRGFYAHMRRKLRNVVKYFSEQSKVKILVDYLRFPNVYIVHCERLKIPHLFSIKRGKNLIAGVKSMLKYKIRKFEIPLYSTLKEELICRIIELYRYKIPNYITFKRGKY